MKKTCTLILCIVMAMTMSLPSLSLAKAGPATGDPGQPKAAVSEDMIVDLLSEGDYREGEAVAVFRKGMDTDIDAKTKELANVSSTSVGLAATEGATAQDEQKEEALDRMAESDGSKYVIKHVIDHSRTTRQILEELYSDPDVISAEPNYIIKAPDPVVSEEGSPSSEQGTSSSFSDRSKLFNVVGGSIKNKSVGNTDKTINAPAKVIGAENNAAGSNVGDLTPYQWSMTNMNGKFVSPASNPSDYSMNVPGWKEGRTNPSAPKNSSGTVCIVDSGIDTTHPDLKDSLFTFSKAQQKKYKCGPHGINVSGSKNKKDVSDYSAHGSHVAGIVAASWNKEGVSGVAHGTKIFSVRVFDDTGDGSTATTTIQAFQFLIDVAKDVNLKAANCSWGDLTPHFVLTTMVNELGSKGANTVFAAGNRSLDLDKDKDTGPMINSPYCIIVDGAMTDGKKGDFSCWGQHSTDIFSAGSQILSTVPSEVTVMTEVNTPMASSILTRFFPEASAPSDLPMPTERFDGSTSKVRFFDKNPALYSDAVETGRRGNMGFDDRHDMEFDVKSLKPSPSDFSTAMPAKLGSVYMAVLVDKADDVKWLNVAESATGITRILGGIASITCRLTENGKPVQIDNFGLNFLNKGWDALSRYTYYQCQWSTLNVNVPEMIKASNEMKNVDPAKLEEQALKYTYPGDVDGLYEWTDKGQKYVICEVGMSEAEPGKPIDKAKMHLDNVAAGGESAYTGAYEYMPGTSMAAPTISGALSVAAKNESPNKKLSAKKLKKRSLARAAKILASVRYDKSLSKLCTTGGAFDFSRNPGLKKKAPIITSATATAKNLKIKGYFFGKKSNLYVDDKKVKVKSWKDTVINGRIKKLRNGNHVAKVVKKDGTTFRSVFSYSVSKSKGKMLYSKKLPIPTTSKKYKARKDELYNGNTAVCGSKFFIPSINVKDEFQGLLMFNAKKNKWSHCKDAPKQLKNKSSFTMTGFKGKVYFYVVSSGNKNLWIYDPGKNKWKRSKIEFADSSLSLVSIGSRLFAVDPSFSKSPSKKKKEFAFGLIDLKKNKVIPVKGHFKDSNSDALQSRLVSYGKYGYVYCPEGSDETKASKGMLARFSYNAKKKKMTVKDLTKTIKKKIKTFETDVALAAYPKGAALITGTRTGKDTLIIKNKSKKVSVFKRTLSYNKVFYPYAAWYKGKLYAGGCNEVDQGKLFFRSTTLK